jgi:hypothetical protein
VRDGVTGLVAAGPEDFIAKAKLVATTSKLHRSLRDATRLSAGGTGWDKVLDDLSEAYQASLHIGALGNSATALAAS